MTTQLFTCSDEDSAHRAAQIMWDHDCGAVPVVDVHGHAVSIVTDRDLCMAAYTRGLPLAAIALSSLLSSTLHVCSPTTSIEEAIVILRKHRIRRLVVVGPGDRRVVGFLSLADIALHLGSITPAHPSASGALSELLASISQRGLRGLNQVEGQADVNQAAE